MSFLLLLFISPVFLTLVLLVKLSSPGPIFFRQPRVGRDGRVFDCLKFRTMRAPDAADAAFQLKTGAAPGGVEGVDRRTKIGKKILRATSLDELPQFLNVLKGEMSLVGPPARTAGVRRTLRGADPAIRRAAPGSRRCHRLGSGARLTWADVHRRSRRVGQLLHRELLYRARPQDLGADDSGGAASRGVKLR